MWFFSRKKISFIILVVAPLSISIVALTRVVDYFVFAGLAYLIAALVYGFYPYRYSAVQYFFKERDIEYALIEYEFIKRIVYLEIPIVIIAAITIPFAFYAEFSPIAGGGLLSNATELNARLNATFTYPIKAASNIPEAIKDRDWGILAPINTLTYSVTGGIIWISIQTRKRDFGFYLAKAYFQIIAKKKDQTDKVNYLIECLKSYDTYLRRNLNLRINAELVYSKIMGDTDIDMNEAIRSVAESFENQHDKFRLIKSISKIAKIKETEKILLEQSIVQRIKNLAGLFATIIGIITSIFQFVLPAAK